MNEHYLQLCLVTHRQTQSFESYQDLILKSVRGGITSVQLRDKKASSNELLEMAFALKKLLAPYPVSLIINDHIEIAKAVKADGIHLGQSDTSPAIAREVLGPHIKIGLSIESEAQLTQSNQLDCIDYIAASAVFKSSTKVDCERIWGLDGLKQVCHTSRFPVIAIGGILLDNIDSVMQCGVAGVAVVGAIHQASCPQLAAEELFNKVKHYS